MVTVVCTKAFTYHDQMLTAGQDVEMVPIDAAVHARLGHVSLCARPTYQTRDMQVAPVTVAERPTAVVPEPVKKRRGRPRKKTSA